MHFLKKISIIIIIIVSLIIMDRLTYSEDNQILIKDVVIDKNKDVKEIKFNQEINFDSLIIKAIKKGIPLSFKVTLRVVKIDDIWPTKTILKKVGYYQIEYKALRKVYRIEDINGKNYEYKQIDEAIQKILKVEDFKFKFIDNHMNNKLWLNVELDRNKLPKPLQVNFFDRTWYMNSNKSIHQL